MRRIITEMEEDGGLILVYDVNPITGLIESRMNAEEFTSKEGAKKAHAKIIDHWPEMLSSEEVNGLIKEISELGNKKKSQEEEGFKKRMLASIEGRS